MYSVNNIENIIIIKKSKFIVNLIYVENDLDLNNNLNLIKNKYKDATHNCYAYIMDNNKRYSDNNEPSGTAGKPILDVLEKNNLNNILCVVTRYFGGIKLGSNGLIRAYSNTVKDTLKLARKIEVVKGVNVELSFSYDQTNDIDKTIENFVILNKEYKEHIIYNLNIDYETLEKLKKLELNIKIIKEVKIKKTIK